MLSPAFESIRERLTSCWTGRLTPTSKHNWMSRWGYILNLKITVLQCLKRVACVWNFMTFGLMVSLQQCEHYMLICIIHWIQQIIGVTVSWRKNVCISISELTLPNYVKGIHIRDVHIVVCIHCCLDQYLGWWCSNGNIPIIIYHIIMCPMLCTNTFDCMEIRWEMLTHFSRSLLFIFVFRFF